MLFSFSSEPSNALLRLIAQLSQVKPTIEPTVELNVEPTVEPTVKPNFKLIVNIYNPS
jgi:hypothetical protein